MQKQRELEAERRRLDDARRSLEEEERKKKAALDNYREEARRLIEQKQVMKQKEKEDKVKERAEYQRLVEESSVKQKLREDNYKNFYKSCMDQQAQKEKLYAEAVYTDKSTKDKGINEFIEKGVNAGLQKNDQDLYERYRKKQDQLKDYAQTLQHQIQSKEQIKELEKYDRQRRYEENIRRSMEIDQVKALERNERLERQKEYKTILDLQAKDKEHIASSTSLYRMTEAERKMNEAGVYERPMIPGVYSGEYLNRKPAALLAGAGGIRTPTGLPAVNSMPSPLAGPSGSNTANENQYVRASLTLQDKGPNYNPITNPIPNVTQNPYVLKEMRRNNITTGSNANLLASMANANILAGSGSTLDLHATKSPVYQI
eukprot:TRINITY_DN7372_c0_g1_i1.p1 TRINITY_DN7372_c0_g1~~TRINITY_DN7372_c0_g1_i1.p1  ORF type:complete len:373 (+),score=89.21 TRINITY_DN7372_c0_g1_i1:526-1644(+)